MRTMATFSFLILVRTLALGQAVALPEFEVASIRAAAPTSPADHGGVTHGGPGTPDPGRIQFRSFTLRELILQAYHIPNYRLVTPDSFTGRFFDIVANLPAGTNQDQLELMLQNLLADRFGLRLHRQPTPFDTYRIVVARGGAKLKPTTFTTADVENHALLHRDSDGTILMLGRMTGAPLNNGTTVIAMGKAGLPDLARNLEAYLRLPVTDATGLPGEYDIKFTAAETKIGVASVAPSAQSRGGEAADPAPDIFQALEQQLGLKLEKTKALLDVIVVDYPKTVPTEN